MNANGENLLFVYFSKDDKQTSDYLCYYKNFFIQILIW